MRRTRLDPTSSRPDTCRRVRTSWYRRRKRWDSAQYTKRTAFEAWDYAYLVALSSGLVHCVHQGNQDHLFHRFVFFDFSQCPDQGTRHPDAFPQQRGGSVEDPKRVLVPYRARRPLEEVQYTCPLDKTHRLRRCQPLVRLGLQQVPDKLLRPRPNPPLESAKTGDIPRAKKCRQIRLVLQTLQCSQEQVLARQEDERKDASASCATAHGVGLVQQSSPYWRR